MIDLAFEEEFFELLDKFALIVKTFFYNDIELSAPTVFMAFSVDKSCFLLVVPLLVSPYGETLNFLRHCLMDSQYYSS